MAQSWLCMILFFTPLFLTAELSVLPSVPVWTFPCWPWGPVHRVQVMGSLAGGQTVWFGCWFCVFSTGNATGDAKEEPVHMTGYTCNKSNANSFYSKTVHLFICQMLSHIKHIHRYTFSLSGSLTPRISFIYIKRWRLVERGNVQHSGNHQNKGCI